MIRVKSVNRNGLQQVKTLLSKLDIDAKITGPNCDKTHYKDLNLCYPDELCRQIKNPVNYAVKKYFKNNYFLVALWVKRLH